MKIQTTSLKLTAVTMAVALGLFIIVPAPLLALSSASFKHVAATPGTPCNLPDGSSGFYQDDQNTCCPTYKMNQVACLYAKYVNPLIQLLSAVVGLVVVFGVIYGGFEYITSAGDPQRVAAAKKRITDALVAFTAFILLYAFLQFLIPGGLFHGK